MTSVIQYQWYNNSIFTHDVYNDATVRSRSYEEIEVCYASVALTVWYRALNYYLHHGIEKTMLGHIGLALERVTVSKCLMVVMTACWIDPYHRSLIEATELWCALWHHQAYHIVRHLYNQSKIIHVNIKIGSNPIINTSNFLSMLDLFTCTQPPDIQAYNIAHHKQKLGSIKLPGVCQQHPNGVQWAV